MADESCDFAVVRAIRTAGHDVLAIAEVSPRATDEVVLRLASDERRVLLTEDTDFGELVYAERHRNAGVILFRFPSTVRSSMAAAAVEAVNLIGEQLTSSFVVIQPGRIRIDSGTI